MPIDVVTCDPEDPGRPLPRLTGIENVGSTARDVCGTYVIHSNLAFQPHESPKLTIRPTWTSLHLSSHLRIAIERNYLSHVRLGLLLSLLSSAVLLSARLSTGNGPYPDETDVPHAAAIPLGSLYFAASVATIFVGWWCYDESRAELIMGKGFIGEFR